MDRADIVTIVTRAVQNQLHLIGEDETNVDDDSVLLGSDPLVDSLGLVNVVIDIEQELADRDILVTIVNEKAMSLRNSPFRTVGTLAGYTLELVADAAERG